MGRGRVAGVFALGVLLTLVVGGCGVQGPTVSGGPTASQPGPSVSATPTSGQAVAPDNNAAPDSPGSGSDQAAGPDRCHSNMLALSLGNSEGAAGTVYQAVRLRNTSGRTCTLQGFPGVSYVTGDNGAQVGAAAVHQGAEGAVVRVAPSAVASVDVGMVNVQNFEAAACKPTPVRGLRVYPPNETASLFLPISGTGCAANPPGGAQLNVSTVHAGPGQN